MKKYTIYITRKYVATVKMETNCFDNKTIEKLKTLFRTKYGKEDTIEITEKN